MSDAEVEQFWDSLSYTERVEIAKKAGRTDWGGQYDAIYRVWCHIHKQARKRLLPAVREEMKRRGK